MTKSKTESDILNTDRPENHLLTYMQPTIRTIELHSCTPLLQVSGNRGYDPDDENPFGN